MRELEKAGEALRSVKSIQYVMLVLLLVCALALPALGSQRVRTAETAGSSVSGDGTAEGSVSGGDMAGSLPEGKVAGNGAPDGSVSGAKGTIVLDAGHGGDDPGMTGRSGITERVLNLVYAKKLQALLTEAGYRVVMTRETEGGLYDEDASHKKAQDMQRRVAVIEKEQPLLTVSIHQNSYQDSAVCGPQVFFYEHSAEGERLAKSIQESLNTELSIARPRVHKENGTYYILKRSKSTTVIVECGFLSNPEEEAKLQQEAYQDQVAQAVFDGIGKYLQEAGGAAVN